MTEFRQSPRHRLDESVRDADVIRAGRIDGPDQSIPVRVIGKDESPVGGAGAASFREWPSNPTRKALESGRKRLSHGERAADGGATTSAPPAACRILSVVA